MAVSFDRRSVNAWVDYIQTLHAREIDMSLERVRKVYLKLCPGGPPFRVISVAGTNGKGSTSEILASIYRQAGFRAAKFTSPHLQRFNERFSVDGVDADDAELIAAFETVEQARENVPITYFEYGLLLALSLFQQQGVDLAIMEVGLGGRLDAVNVLDADAALVTSIALDHTDWLGDSLDQIAYEKSGIARGGRPCVIGVREPQKSMLGHMQSIGAQTSIVGRDFDFIHHADDTWGYQSGDWNIDGLALPFSQGGVQLSNASVAIRCIQTLSERLPVTESAIRQGLASATLTGRCQLLSRSPEIVLDVSHNEASLARLTQFIHSLQVSGRVVAVCGMLKDKEIAASLAQIAPIVSDWHLISINAERGSEAEQVLSELQSVVPSLNQESVQLYNDASTAYRSARATLTADDCLVVFGSFYVVGDILGSLKHNQH